MLLLLIVGCPFVHPELKDGDGVGELLCSDDTSALCLSKSSLFASLQAGNRLLLFLFEILLSLVLLLELLLKGFDVALEGLLLELVVSLEGKDLVVGLLGQSLA